MEVPFCYPDITQEDKDAVIETLGSKWLTGGQRTVEFEKKFAEYVGVKYAVAVNSCTAALHLAMRGIGIKKGDEVIVPTLTFAATANAPIFCGAKPVFVDIDEETFNISPASILEKITQKTKAIIPVHIAGQPCEMEDILRIALKHNLFVVEDCAHSLGAKYLSWQTGSMGVASCFPSQTSILTDKGKVQIHKIQVGDKVRTASGQYESVLNIYKRKYEGLWCKLFLGFHGMREHIAKTLTMTDEHPVLTYRDGKKEWIKAGNLENNDWVYTLKSKCLICGRGIPIFWQLCEMCNPAQLKDVKTKISNSKNKGKHKSFYYKHYYNDILPYANRLQEQGFRVIPIGVAVPDIIALKDGQVFAYEIENGIPSDRKRKKYSDDLVKYYDDIIWIGREGEKHKKKNKMDYEVDGELVRIRVKSVRKYKRNRSATVYNLEVSGDHTYFAGGIIVHNCFSFYPTKPLVTGEGGMLTTNDRELAKDFTLMRTHCASKEALERNQSSTWQYDIVGLGYNYRMPETSAALGMSQLARVDEMNGKRAKISEYYSEKLSGIKGIITPKLAENRTTSNHLYIIRVVEKEFGMSRGQLFDELAKKGIECSVHYTPLHRMSFYRERYGYKASDFPIAEKVYPEILSLPIFSLMTHGQAEYVVECIEELVE